MAQRTSANLIRALYNLSREHDSHKRKSLLNAGLIEMIKWFSLAARKRTSDSLNEELPIKMTREKFQRKCYFFYEKDSRFNPRLIHKSRFLIGQVPIKKYGLKTLFLLFNI